MVQYLPSTFEALSGHPQAQKTKKIRLAKVLEQEQQRHRWQPFLNYAPGPAVSIHSAVPWTRGEHPRNLFLCSSLLILPFLPLLPPSCFSVLQLRYTKSFHMFSAFSPSSFDFYSVGIPFSIHRTHPTSKLILLDHEQEPDRMGRGVFALGCGVKRIWSSGPALST